MRFLFVEAFAGASGDMFFGALADLGVSVAEVEQALRTLPLPGWRLSYEKTRRGAIAATKVHVHLDALGGGEEGYLTADAHGHRHGDRHHHDHDHDHGHQHHHDDASSHAPHHPHLHEHGRTPGEILSIIDRSGLPQPVKARASDVFRALAAAEARVHGMTPESVHFHEVGAVDAVVDICSTVMGLWLLGVERVFCSSVTTGFGSVRCAHGIVPVPAPATLHLLMGIPARPGAIEAELLTPTGAALLKTLVTDWVAPPLHRALATGFGAGSSDWDALPNVLRVTLGEADDRAPRAAGAPTTVRVAEFEVDDMRSEALGFLRERLEAEGALDVSMHAVQMKKNRPGHRVTVLHAPDRADAIRDVIFHHSTTFGFRHRESDRTVLDREIVSIECDLGTCRVKVGRWDGRVIRVRPEYEDVASIARRTGLSAEAVEVRVLAACRARGLEP